MASLSPPTSVEFLVTKVDPAWTAEMLWQQTGIFRLADIVTPLHLNARRLNTIKYRLQRNGESPVTIMGMWTHSRTVFVNMKKFAAFYHDCTELQARDIPEHWDANVLLSQTGYFLLSEACRILPYDAHQLRYQSKKGDASIGVVASGYTGRYLIRMEDFKYWVTSVQADGGSLDLPEHPKSGGVEP